MRPLGKEPCVTLEALVAGAKQPARRPFPIGSIGRCWITPEAVTPAAWLLLMETSSAVPTAGVAASLR